MSHASQCISCHWLDSWSSRWDSAFVCLQSFLSSLSCHSRDNSFKRSTQICWREPWVRVQMAPLVGLAPAKLLDENQGTLLICLQRHLLKRIFCTSTYHLTASSWLLVDLAMILACCCIGVASVHTLLCREKRSRYIWYIVLSITLQSQAWWRDRWDSNPQPTALNAIELLCVSFKWYLDRATIPEPPDYGVETKTWTWIFS